jgi:hypothetical protein
LAAATAVAAVVYLVEPQSPRDLLDRVLLRFDVGEYGASLRVGERTLGRAWSAWEADADALGGALEWDAARWFSRASAAAPGPREQMLANDRLADVYLEIGRRELERGKGGVLGFGRHAGALREAERAASCLLGIAPTRRRGQINGLVEALESELERPLAGGCSIE